jgi:hypothetical protein
MKNKTLVKTKIVLEDNGKGLGIYYWVPTFWIFGHWVPTIYRTGTIISDKKIKRINPISVSKLFYSKFVKGFE